jgi:hypothetical protein
MDMYHTGKRLMNSGYVSYREEANEFWIRIIQGRGQDTYPEFIGLFPV